MNLIVCEIFFHKYSRQVVLIGKGEGKMRNNTIKNNRGVSLISLVITVIVLIILSNMIIYEAKDNLKLGRLTEMQSDIDHLRDKVASYYAQNGKIPASIPYTNLDKIKSAGIISDVVDTGDFLVIDLSALENLTLNKGKDFEKVKESPESANLYTDLYIINQVSHNIFYVAGVTIDDETFYTDYTSENKDIASVNLKYVKNTKIPDGFYYIEGTDDTEIRIRSDDNTQEYKWISKEEKISNIPDDVEIASTEQEDFIKSVNAYQGYYKNVANDKVIYLELQNWSPVYDKDGIYRDKNEDTAYVPQGFSVSQTPGENTIREGLVVKDSKENEWVWIEVPKSIYTAAMSNEDYENIEKDMQAYVTGYSDGNSTDAWFSEAQHGFVDANQYHEWKNNMLKSVYDKGGFYVGRYEVGTTTLRTSASTVETTPIVQKGAYPYHYVTCKQAQALAKSLATEGKTTSLMFGIQWDLIMKCIETKGDKTQDELKSNSSTWGNYRNILETTGEKNQNCALNIYDLAGNVWEWTLEKGTDNSRPCVVRGGSYENEGNSYPAFCRFHDIISDSNATLGFRAVLY